MFGLFDSPPKAIRKRVPKGHELVITAIETYTSMQLEDLPKHRREIAIGAVLSVWAVNSHSLGIFRMKDFNFRYVYNFGNNCTKRLNEQEQLRISWIMDELIEKELIPKS